jgi:hypothetical protein
VNGSRRRATEIISAESFQLFELDDEFEFELGEEEPSLLLTYIEEEVLLRGVVGDAGDDAAAVFAVFVRARVDAVVEVSRYAELRRRS